MKNVKRMTDCEISKEIKELVDARYVARKSSLPSQREEDLRVEQDYRIAVSKSPE